MKINAPHDFLHKNFNEKLVTFINQLMHSIITVVDVKIYVI